MITPTTKPSEMATRIAAQIWCEPETSEIEMDSRLAVAFARKIDSVAFAVPQSPPEMDGHGFEHVLLSVRIRYVGKPGQLDDSCAAVIRREMMDYYGVDNVVAEVLYKHTKSERHCSGCDCGLCTEK